MSLNLNVDQHRLCTTAEGALIDGGDNSFLIYDTLTNQTVKISLDQVGVVVPFLACQPAVIYNNNTDQHQECTSDACSPDSPPESSTTDKNDEIWVKNAGKPSEWDIKARDDLISLYGSDKFKPLFSDKKSTKKNVWDALGKEMVKKGYNFGDRDAGKVCAQKWRNMEGETLKVIAAAGPKNSGGGTVKKPPYFDDIHDIVKDKAKAVPKNIMDSLDEPKRSDAGDKAVEEHEDGKLSDEEEKAKERTVPQKSPFLKVQSSSHPKKKVDHSEILEFLKSDAEKRDSQNKQLLDFLQKKAKQDDKRKKSFLSVLQTIAGKKRKKPEGLDGDSSSESEG